MTDLWRKDTTVHSLLFFTSHWHQRT